MRLFAGAVAATLMIATPVHALTLIVTVNKSDYESPIIIDVNSTNSEIKKLPSSTSPDTILYNVSSNLEILIFRFELTVNPVPSGYSFVPFKVAAPFFLEKNTINVVAALALMPTSANVKAVRDLYATDVTTLGPAELGEFFQKSRSIAMYRIGRIADDWSKLHPYDVQAAFKFLESAIMASKEYFIMPNAEIESVRNWLSRAISQKPDIVTKGVGKLAYAKTIIQQVDGIEGQLFSKLWRHIAKISNCEQQLSLLEKYKNLMLQVPLGVQTNRIVQATGVPYEEVESSINRCVTRNFKELGPTPGALSALEAQITRIQGITLEGVETAAFQKKLKSDLFVMQDLYAAVEK